MSAQIDGDKLNSFKLTKYSEKSGPIFSAARNIRRKQMHFQIKFRAKEEAKTFLHRTNLCLSFFFDVGTNPICPVCHVETKLHVR